MTDRLTEAAKVHADILRLGLAVHPLFSKLTVDQFAAIYNGIGPDKWPEVARECMTLIYRNFQVLPGVHDVDFYFSDGTRVAWKDSTARWLKNGMVALEDRYPIRNPLNWKMRAAGWLKIRAAWRMLEAFSYPVYCEAHKERLKR